MRRFWVNFVLLLAVLGFAACSVEMPEGVIRPGKMEDLLYDYHLAQVVTSDYSSNSYEKKLHVSYVFEKHGTTKEQFDSSLVWYTRYPKQMVRIYSNLEKRLTAELEVMGNSEEMLADIANAEMMQRDTVNLWRGTSVKLLSSAPLVNRFTFDYTADSTYVSGDSLVLAFSARFVPSKVDSLDCHAHAALLVEYTDKSIGSAGVQLDKNGLYAVGVARDFERSISAVRGFVYYADNDTSCVAKLLLGDIAVKRIHPLREE